MKFAAIADWADQGVYPVVFMCRELQVSTSGYYKWRSHRVSARHDQDDLLMGLIRHFYASSPGRPGVRRIHAELAAGGHRVSRKRVWRLMRALGVQGRHPAAWRRTTVAGEHPVPAPDGRHYVFVKALTESNWEIYLGDLAGGEPRRLTWYDNIDLLPQVSPDARKMNWARAAGPGMKGIRTYVMDVSSLDLGAEHRVPFDPGWGRPMTAAAPR